MIVGLLGPPPYGGKIMIVADGANSILLMRDPVVARWLQPRWLQTVADETVKFRPNPKWEEDVPPPVRTDRWDFWILREPVVVSSLSPQRRPAMIDRMACHPDWSPLRRPPYRPTSRTRPPAGR